MTEANDTNPNDANRRALNHEDATHDMPTRHPRSGSYDAPERDATTHVRRAVGPDRTGGEAASGVHPPRTASPPTSRPPAVTAAWRRPTAVALLMALLAALTFAAVTVVVRSRHDDRSTPVVTSPGVSSSIASSGPSTRASSDASSPSSPSTSRSAAAATTAPTTAQVAPAQQTTDQPAAAAPTDTPSTESSAASSAPSSASTASTSSSSTSSSATNTPAVVDFPASTGRHCVTDSGGVTSTTATDVRQALTRQSSCALLLTVRDAVHARTAANPTASSYSLRVFSAYRKRVEPTTDGFIDLTCTRAGRFVTCTSVHPPVEIWVRDAS